jgi:hypothetical protein
MDTSSGLKHVEKVLSLLQKAQQHASFAVRSSRATLHERDFVHFLDLMSRNVESVHAMMLNQDHLEQEESFLCKFLATNHEECALPAMAYGRRAEDILQGVWHVLQLALAPYHALRRETLEGMTEEERERHRLAMQSLLEELHPQKPALETAAS